MNSNADIARIKRNPPKALDLVAEVTRLGSAVIVVTRQMGNFLASALRRSVMSQSRHNTPRGHRLKRP